MINLESINEIECIWTDDGSSYRYEALTESIKTNSELKVLRFTLREIDGQDDDLEIVIQEKADGSCTFKTDYYDNPSHEYALTLFSAAGEQLLHFQGTEGIAYFHLKGTAAKS